MRRRSSQNQKRNLDKNLNVVILMSEKIKIGNEEFILRTKRIHQKDLTPDCWSVQFWGLPYCRTCEYLATDGCGGYEIRKKIFTGKYPKDGLPDAKD